MSYLLAGFFGLASGLAIAGAVFALIAAIGVVPHMAKKTDTARFARLYEEAIIWGGIFGAASMIINIRLPQISAISVLLGVFTGVFFGVFVMSLAEELNVLPIMSKRLGVKRGIPWFVTAIAAGKLVGSLLYFIVTGFFVQGA